MVHSSPSYKWTPHFGIVWYWVFKHQSNTQPFNHCITPVHHIPPLMHSRTRQDTALWNENASMILGLHPWYIPHGWTYFIYSKQFFFSVSILQGQLQVNIQHLQVLCRITPLLTVHLTKHLKYNECVVVGKSDIRKALDWHQINKHLLDTWLSCHCTPLIFL